MLEPMDGPRSGGLLPRTIARNLERALGHARLARLLLIVLSTHGPASSTALAGRLGVSKQTAKRLAWRLKDAGLVRADRRGFALPGQARRARTPPPRPYRQPATQVEGVAWWTRPMSREEFQRVAQERATVYAVRVSPSRRRDDF